MKRFRSNQFGASVLMASMALISGFLIVGCKESDELPPPKETAFVAVDLPGDNPTYEKALKYAVNLAPRANTRSRDIASKALSEVKAEVEKTKDADSAKKLELIAACQARIDTLAQMLKDEALLSKYVLPKTSPSASDTQVRKDLETKKDAEYLKLKKAFEDSTAIHEAAKQKSLDLGKEFIVNTN